jgi:hypothetical protein
MTRAIPFVGEADWGSSNGMIWGDWLCRRRCAEASSSTALFRTTHAAYFPNDSVDGVMICSKCSYFAGLRVFACRFSAVQNRDGRTGRNCGKGTRSSD